jgi:hypothetical protein
MVRVFVYTTGGVLFIGVMSGQQAMELGAKWASEGYGWSEVVALEDSEGGMAYVRWRGIVGMEVREVRKEEEE